MNRLEVRSFSLSIDGYGAGPDQRSDQAAGPGRRKPARVDVRHPHLGAHAGPRRRRDRHRRRLTRRAAWPASARGSWAATCSARIRGPWPDENLEGLVGRRAAVPLPGVRADAPCAAAARDGRRHDLPLRHRRHRCRTDSRTRSGRRRRHPARRRRRRRSARPCARGWSMRCISRSRRCCSARAKPCSPVSTCRRSATDAPSTQRPRRRRMWC